MQFRRRVCNQALVLWLAACAKRFGVFFGVAQYEFNTEAEELTEGKTHLNLPTCHRDARQMAEVLREQGQLNGARVFTNELATRKSMEDAITRWLPSVSRPGDTVFVYFSGPAGQFDTTDLSELDGKDETIAPYDVNAGADTLPVAQRIRRYRDTNILDDTLARWLQELAGRQVVLIFDTCHSGGLVHGDVGRFQDRHEAGQIAGEDHETLWQAATRHF